MILYISYLMISSFQFSSAIETSIIIGVVMISEFKDDCVCSDIYKYGIL